MMLSPRLTLLGCVLVTGCATLTPAQRRAQLKADAETCASFAEFDARIQAESDELVAHAPSDELMAGASALSRARRSCAHFAISRLLELREKRGTQAVEDELDALARAFSPDELNLVLRETLGSGAADLRPHVVEALARRALKRDGERKTPASPPQAADPELPARTDMVDTTPMCVEATNPCERATCFVNQSAEAAALSTAARKCLDSLRPQPPLDRARAMATLVTGLRTQATSGVLTETLLSLETLRRQLWPQIEAASNAQKPALAAQLAEPFVVLDSSRAEVERLRQQAVSFHLGLARQASPHALATRLHRLVAAQLKGPEEPALAGEPGRWAMPRWACTWPQPELPTPFNDVELRLSATCRSRAAKKPDGEPRHDLATFDLEHALERETISGAITANCAGRQFVFDFSVNELVIDSSDTGRAEALLTELHRVTNLAERECRATWAATARRGCDRLLTDREADVEQRFAEAFVATGQWERCFVEYFTRRYGVPPPVLAKPSIAE